MTAVTGTGVAYVDTIKLLEFAFMEYSGVVTKPAILVGQEPHPPAPTTTAVPAVKNTRCPLVSTPKAAPTGALTKLADMLVRPTETAY